MQVFDLVGSSSDPPEWPPGTSHGSFKLVLVGDAGSGKSALLRRFSEDDFLPGYNGTVGVDFKIRRVALELDGEQRLYKLQLWDTAGQERFRVICSTYYRGANGVLVLFDLSSPESFEHVKYWVSEIKQYAREDAVVVLVGNKADLARKISQEEAAKLAESLGCPYIETSALANLNTVAAFELLCRGVAERQPPKQLTEVRLSEIRPRESGFSHEAKASRCGC